MIGVDIVSDILVQYPRKTFEGSRGHEQMPCVVDGRHSILFRFTSLSIEISYMIPQPKDASQELNSFYVQISIKQNRLHVAPKPCAEAEKDGISVDGSNHQC